MKIIDQYILKTFLITFLTVFVILFFIFILQSVWLFIAELAGKDLDFVMILKFLFYSMPRIIPMVLPLSILLASIMSFGNFAENYEFAAMKSAGISLQRSMKMLTIFIFLLSICAFFFANNVIPYAEYKFINFRKNIAQMQPALAITEGQFSEIGNYAIKVDKKSGEKGNLLTNVTIHKKSKMGYGINTIIKSKSGELIGNEGSNILKLILKDGYYYEDIEPVKYEDRVKEAFAKAYFKKNVFNIDLSSITNVSIDNTQIVNANTMLNFGELTYTIDSLNENYNKDIQSFSVNIYQRTGATNINTIEPFSKKEEINQDLLSMYSSIQRPQILQVAASNVGNTLFSIEGTFDEMNFKEKNINDHWLALYDKFVIAYACLLMFFIGAPLGAIIRKGGLGLPIVFAIVIFILFHFVNTFGRRVAQENEMSPLMGSWLSSFILTPLAIVLTYRATNDIGSLNTDRILLPIQNWFQKRFSSKKIN